MKSSFLICYDISDVKRLSKIGKRVEKRALRIQKSIYLFEDVTKIELQELIEDIMKIFDNKKDDLRIYKIKDKGLHLGAAMDLENPLIF